MYLAPPVAVVVLLLAAVGALALVTSVGVFVFTAGLPDAPEPSAAPRLPASEVVAAHTGNVRVVRDPLGVANPRVGYEVDGDAIRRELDAS